MNEVPNRGFMHKLRDRALVIGGVVLVTSAAYVGLLGWDQRKYREPGSINEQGPYEPWQVVMLIVALALTAVIAGALGQVLEPALAMSATLTLFWSVDAATGPSQGDATFWPMGVVAILVVTTGAALLLAAATQAAVTRRE